MFEDFAVGHRFETTATVLSEADILEFAGRYDPQPFHLDAAAAEASIYGGIIASGFQTLLVAFNLTLAQGGWAAASMGSPGMRDIAWRAPVRPGDALHVCAEVQEARVSASKPDRGFVVIRYAVINQADVVVMVYTATHILRRR